MKSFIRCPGCDLIVKRRRHHSPIRIGQDFEPLRGNISHAPPGGMVDAQRTLFGLRTAGV